MGFGLWRLGLWRAFCFENCAAGSVVFCLVVHLYVSFSCSVQRLPFWCLVEWLFVNFVLVAGNFVSGLASLVELLSVVVSFGLFPKVSTSPFFRRFGYHPTTQNEKTRTRNPEPYKPFALHQSPKPESAKPSIQWFRCRFRV